ncbi:GNAT family N-acetyltransferase [Vallitalea okinawensis]|uniref:GNAT family N-acetyltransferase n=1 Tax=Vallitalea okinawensis TaxID=2078660 RepID=UPI00130061E0|nr:GNAT family protein [Vallitalea okinawensis]
MKFEFVPMTLDYADLIKKWKYTGYVKSIYMEPYFDTFNETGKMRGPGGCEGFVVLNQSRLVGLFEYYFIDEIMEIGLALKPELTGKGYGKDFVHQGIKFGIKNFEYKRKYIKLTVNILNKPAIKVYEKVGFEEHKRNEGEIEMRKYLT